MRIGMSGMAAGVAVVALALSGCNQADEPAKTEAAAPAPAATASVSTDASEAEQRTEAHREGMEMEREAHAKGMEMGSQAHQEGMQMGAQKDAPMKDDNMPMKPADPAKADPPMKSMDHM